MLTSTNFSHTGKYECSVSLTSGGYDPVTASAMVTVQEKPMFISNLKSETLGDYGSPITMPCDVDGIPKPNVTWYKNAEVVEEGPDKRYRIEEDNSLVIKKLLISDMGMFQCFAKNDAGETSMSTWLKVKSKFIKY